jgi:thioredoxin 1
MQVLGTSGPLGGIGASRGALPGSAGHSLTAVLTDRYNSSDHLDRFDGQTPACSKANSRNARDRRDFFDFRELLTMSNVAEFTDNNFQSEVLQSNQPVLVDFWATWCGPCRAVAPMIDELATQYAGSVKVGKLNIDDSPKIAQELKVFSIPTLVIFHGGQDVQRFVGVQPKAKIQEALDSVQG